MPILSRAGGEESRVKTLRYAQGDSIGDGIGPFRCHSELVSESHPYKRDPETGFEMTGK